jgi:CRISPR/Cas system-associated endonuclease Cas1
MSWRTVVISKRAKLDLKNNFMVVRRNEGFQKIYLGEMSVLIIESTAVSLTASLLVELMKRKVKVVFCDEAIMVATILPRRLGDKSTGRTRLRLWFGLKL